MNFDTFPQEPLFEPTYLSLEYVFAQIASVLEGIVSIFSGESGSVYDAYQTLGFFTSLLSIFFLIVILYSLVRAVEVYGYRRRRLEQEIADAQQSHVPVPEPTQNKIRWQQILGKTESDNPSDWKVAILEADVMLDELLIAQGFRGEGLGERLMNAEIGDFLTLNQAWQAHKMRNRIAHDPEEASMLTEREVRRTISLYQQVFEEFDWI